MKETLKARKSTKIEKELLLLEEPVVSSLKSLHILALTDIQKAAFKPVLQGKNVWLEN